MECKECQELLFDYDEFDANLQGQINKHVENCHSCQNEWNNVSLAMNFFKKNMPVITVDSSFSEQVIYKIDVAEATTTFIKPIEEIGLLLAVLMLGLLVLIGPTVVGLVILAGKILLGLLSMSAVVFASFPLIQISTMIILGALLLLVTVYMRHMVLHDSV